MIGAALLAGAALLPDRPVREPRRAMVLVLTASIGVLVANLAVAATLRDVLPAAFAVPPESGEELRLLSEHPALIVVELLTAACFFIAALAFARLADEQDDEFQKWLSIGSVIAGMAFVNYALFPSQFTELHLQWRPVLPRRDHRPALRRGARDLPRGGGADPRRGARGAPARGA